MFKCALGELLGKGVGRHGRSKIRPSAYMLKSSIHSGRKVGVLHTFGSLVGISRVGGLIGHNLLVSPDRGMPHSGPRSFFGVEDYVDDDNSRPYTYKKEKKSKNPQKHISFKQRTVAYMEPFTLDVFISKRFVQASITHRVTCKQVAVAGTNSKDIKAALQSRCDIPACLAIGRFLADRAREADVYTASYTPRDRDKFEGKIRAVVQSLIDNGIDVKIYLD